MFKWGVCRSLTEEALDDLDTAKIEACGAGGLSAIQKARLPVVLERLYRRVGKGPIVISVRGIKTASVPGATEL